MSSDFDSYVSVSDWYEAMKTHPCRKRIMCSNDDPKNRSIGGFCSGCGRYFVVDLAIVQATIKECGTKIMSMMISPEGRRVLVSSCSDKEGE